MESLTFNCYKGASFSGDVAMPVTVGGVPLYFRGRAILQSIIEELQTKHSLDQASEVLLTGASAGGLSTYLHADHVHAMVAQASPNVKFGALPDCGLFLNHSTYDHPALFAYGDQMRK